MIKVLICDGDGTLQLPNPSQEVRDFLNALQKSGIQLVVASNNRTKSSIINNFRNANLPIPAIIVTPTDVHARKPSPAFIDSIRKQTGARLEEIVYLGDDDNTDAFCAINARVLPIAARYSSSGKPMDYGIPIDGPSFLSKYLTTYGMQDPPYFGWQCSFRCSDTGTNVDVRALIGNHGRLGLTAYLKIFLKENLNIKVGKNKVPFGQILFYYLVSQTYQSGLLSQVDCVAVYPGHMAHSQNAVLENFSTNFRKAFRQRYTPELLIRHADAQASHLSSGANRDIYEQFRTIMVNQDHINRIQGRTILVLDDFTTSGSSLETARRMLLKSGAGLVIGVAMAKYRNNYYSTVINGDWDPFSPCTLQRGDIVTIPVRGSLNDVSDDYFHNIIWSTFVP